VFRTLTSYCPGFTCFSDGSKTVACILKVINIVIIIANMEDLFIKRTSNKTSMTERSSSLVNHLCLSNQIIVDDMIFAGYCLCLVNYSIEVQSIDKVYYHSSHLLVHSFGILQAA
jgi:hypothetical protein